MADENNITTLAKRLRPFIKLAAQQVIIVDPGDHGLLTGLGDDDHSQYVHNTSARTITAQHSFSPGAAAAPFTLGANAQGQTVIGLKADQLNKSITAGNGLSGGGMLTENRTIDLQLPGTLSVSSSNNASGSHTHAITSSSDPADSAKILATNSQGYLSLIKLQTDWITDRSGGNMTIGPAGDITLNPGGNDILPLTNYDLNLGAINKKYLTLHAAELWVETLVAQDTLATIGGRILVAPTTTLTRDLPAGNTSIYVKHNQMAWGDRVYLEASGKVEWIAIASSGTLQGEGDYLYSVTRNLDGSGSDDWYAGDAIVNSGTTGDGYIDIYSMHSIRSGTQYGPTIVGNIRTGATYSDLVEGWAIGNLNGLYGYGTDTYGVAFGKYINSSSFLTIDPTNGIRMIYKDNGGTEATLAQWTINGNLTIGEVGASKDNIYISAGAISIRNNITERIGITSDGILTIKDSGGAAVFTFNASAGAEFTKSLTLATTGGIYQGTGTFDSPTTGLKIYNSGGYGKISGYNAGSEQWYAGTDGKLYAGGGSVKIDINGVSLLDGDATASYYKFVNVSGETLSRLSGYSLSGGTPHNYGNFQVMPISGFNSENMIVAAALTTYHSSTLLRAVSGGTSYIDFRLYNLDSPNASYALLISDTPADAAMLIQGNLQIGTTSELITGTTGDILFTGGLKSYKNSTVYTGYIFVPLTTPLTSTSWDGDSYSTTAKTLIDLSAVFGAPAGVKAVLDRIEMRDSGSAGFDAYLFLSPVDTAGVGLMESCAGLGNDYRSRGTHIVPCDANGDIYYQINASGSLTMDVKIEIWGYWI